MCVCLEEDVYQAIQLALNERIVLVAFGDMLRVPVNAPKREARSLEAAKALGADVRPIASPAEAAQIAHENPDVAVVLFATGFETTIAPVAAMFAEGVPDNLFVLLSGRLTWPVVAMLLESEAPGFEALIAPGHVSAVMGSDEWNFVVERHALPAAVAGFTPESLPAAFYSVLRQRLEGKRFLDNCYPEVVRAEGNPTAKALLAQTLDVVDAPLARCGRRPPVRFRVKASPRRARRTPAVPAYDSEARRRRGEMPPGCDCARGVLGRIYPDECYLYGRACTPRHPVGPCMVSEEGACRIWWAAGYARSRADKRGLRT